MILILQICQLFGVAVNLFSSIAVYYNFKVHYLKYKSFLTQRKILEFRLL